MSKHTPGPWVKVPRQPYWRHPAGYVIERVARNVWDAFLPSGNGELDYRQACWTSPRHPTMAAAMSAVTIQIRQVHADLRAAIAAETGA